MNTLIGREDAVARLKRAEASNKSEFVCVYGRRRVGKTYLVTSLYQERFAFYATGSAKKGKVAQLNAFRDMLHKYGDPERKRPADWDDAFYRLHCLLERPETPVSAYGKKIVFLDEFPWFNTNGDEFLAAFGRFLSNYCPAKANIMVIACGSATGWIIDKILKNTGSLYNRLTRQAIFLEPFTLRQTELFFQSTNRDFSRKDIVLAQMIFGGLPYFYDLLEPGFSIRESINDLLLSKHGMLKDEVYTLLETTLKKSRIYSDILRELSKHKYGMKKSELKAIVTKSSRQFDEAISSLAECEYINEYSHPSLPYHPKYVQLVDPFILFHYHFLADGEPEYRDWQDYVDNEGAYNNWRGNAFEILCLYHVDQIKQALGISAVKTSQYPWHSKKKAGGAQIDLVIDRADILRGKNLSRYFLRNTTNSPCT